MSGTRDRGGGKRTRVPGWVYVPECEVPIPVLDQLQPVRGENSPILQSEHRSLFSPHPVHDPAPNSHADEPQTIERALLHTVAVQQHLCHWARYHDWRREHWRCYAWSARAGGARAGDARLELRVWSASGDVVAGGGSAGDVPAGVHLETRELEI
ncbi:hypothetical protein EDD18DRAFT_1336919 [Armillaria luteobubalina]|uniref:Uncharacterized protein n=1 Tax=Armillaria luteobubalina TaxID=153913 RepID=A0AA39UJ97_9AGAR|nr:hypothetical protein EDD18DRAFT_1336919 [Armillaria luteobubalina]